MRLFDPRQAKGRRAENAAVKALKSRGYRILHRNYRHRLGEIDVVAEDGDVLAFVEVRSKTQGGPVNPIESIGPAKRRRLATLAHLYLERERIRERPCRFDVVEVILSLEGKVSSVEILPDAFSA